MVRAHQVLYGVGRAEPADGESTLKYSARFEGLMPWRELRQSTVSADEERRWQQCDTSDRRAIVLTAFVRVTVDAEGTVRAVWRHEQEAGRAEVFAQC
jgi:hypothetical protein